MLWCCSSTEVSEEPVGIGPNSEPSLQGTPAAVHRCVEVEAKELPARSHQESVGEGGVEHARVRVGDFGDAGVSRQGGGATV